MKKVLLAALAFMVLSSCSSRRKEPEPPRPHRATIVNDLFQVEQGMPIREVRQDQEFFFKRCEVVRSRPHFSKTEYDCNDY